MLRPLAVAALLSLTAIAAEAETAAPVSAKGVVYGDLNLSNPRDAAILADRLQVAATEVCLNANDTKAPIGKILVRRCVSLAVSKATAQILDEIENSHTRAIRANLVSARQRVASAD